MISKDPRDLISIAPMSSMQITVVAMTIMLNALDGFDVLSISFASPGIAAEWDIDRAALGIVLSMELIGMALGSIFLGRLADRIGRRSTVLCCLILMTVGMFMVTTVSSVMQLSIWRIVTGVGIGGMLATTNALTSEFANARSRHLCISLMVIGYPVGAVIGGSITAQLLKTYDWRVVFYLGSSMTAAIIPLVYFYVPESIHWLTHKRPKDALAKINNTLKRMGHGAIEALPESLKNKPELSVSSIFSTELFAKTLLMTAAYFFHIITFYFVLKWIPKIVVDMGFHASAAAGVLVWANVGGAIGGALFGFLTLKYNVRILTIVILMLSVVMVTLFGRSPADIDKLSMLCAFTGFCTNAGVVGLYAMFAQVYPSHVRATGTGFSIGLGRGGAVIAPIFAGFLFVSGISVPVVAMVMATGSIIAAIMLVMLRLQSESV
jgi:benzoate transport